MNSKLFSVGDSLSLALTTVAQQLEDAQIEDLITGCCEYWRAGHDGQEMPSDVLTHVRDVATEAVRNTPRWQAIQRIRQEPTPEAKARRCLDEFGDVFGLGLEGTTIAYTKTFEELLRMGVEITHD